ncbi:MAG: hypothetical protein HY366_01105 [Candidatus Aenigmarchaeota archaeon]|nr:hypothetical protein [Candidatus Aenigmarchaeota archaeon]
MINTRTRYGEKGSPAFRVATFALPTEKQLRENLVDMNKAVIYSTVWSRLKQDGYLSIDDPDDTKYEWFLEMEPSGRGSLIVRGGMEYMELQQQNMDPKKEPDLTDEALDAPSELLDCRVSLTRDLLDRIGEKIDKILDMKACNVQYTPTFGVLYAPQKERWRRNKTHTI